MPMSMPDPERDEDRWYPDPVVKGRIPGRDEIPYDVSGLDLSGRILELGSGNGQLRPLVTAAGGVYVGVDKDPQAREIELDYERTPRLLPDGPFDGIYSRNSISTSWETLPVIAQELSDRLAYPRCWAWISLWTGDSDEDMIASALRGFHELGFDWHPEYRGTNQVLVAKMHP